MDEIEGRNKVAVESCHRVLNLLSSKPEQQQEQDHMSLVSDETREAVSRFKNVSSLLSSSVGHARFRRGKNLQTHLPQTIFLDHCQQKTELPSKPSEKTPSGYPELSLRPSDSLTLGTKSFGLNPNPKAPPPHTLVKVNQQDYLGMFREQRQQQQYLLHERLQAHRYHHHQQQQQLQQKQHAEIMLRKCNGGISLSFDNNSPTLSSTRSFISSLSIDGSSVANTTDGKKNSFHLVGVPSSTDNNKRKCSGSIKCGSSSRCHCTKKRKNRVRRSIRVPAISNKVADIPPDDYSWRKYGQKPIKGSPYPRGYYKCSSMRGCPARKHVERCLEDPAMLIVTYEAEHNHPKIPSQAVTT